MEDEFFNFDIPGIDPKELRRAKKIAQKDINNEISTKVPRPGKIIREARTNSGESKEVRE